MLSKQQNFNIVLIGDKSAGKTSLIKRYINDEDDVEEKPIFEAIRLIKSIKGQ